MLSHLSPEDAGIIIGSLVSALISVGGFAVWLIRYIITEQRDRITLLDGHVGAIAQITRSTEAIAATLDTALGVIREMRIVQEMQLTRRLTPDEPHH